MFLTRMERRGWDATLNLVLEEEEQQPMRAEGAEPVME